MPDKIMRNSEECAEVVSEIYHYLDSPLVEEDICAPEMEEAFGPQTLNERMASERGTVQRRELEPVMMFAKNLGMRGGAIGVNLNVAAPRMFAQSRDLRTALGGKFGLGEIGQNEQKNNRWSYLFYSGLVFSHVLGVAGDWRIQFEADAGLFYPFSNLAPIVRAGFSFADHKDNSFGGMGLKIEGIGGMFTDNTDLTANNDYFAGVVVGWAINY